MTTQNQKPGSSNKTLLRRSVPEWSLKANNEGMEGQVFPLWGEHFVGREDCEILLTDPHASRRHAKLSLSSGILRVEDLNSANNTFVNGEKIVTAVLKDGDIVCFDKQEFTVIGSKEVAKTRLRTAADPEKIVRKTPRKPNPAKKAPRTKTPPLEDLPAGNQVSTDDLIGEATVGTQDERELQPVTRKEKLNDLHEPLDKGATRKMDPNDLREQLVGGGRKVEPNELREPLDKGATRKMDPNDLREQLVGGGRKAEAIGSQKKSSEGAARAGAERVEMPSLVGTTGSWAGRVFQLSGEVMTIGRVGVDISLNEPSISTKHAQIIKQKDQWKVVDLMSANGVYVNGKKTQASFLSPGDTVRFGRLELRFTIDSLDKPSTASSGKKQTMMASVQNFHNNAPAWLFVVVGFAGVLAIGAYVLLSN